MKTEIKICSPQYEDLKEFYKGDEFKVANAIDTMNTLHTMSYDVLTSDEFINNFLSKRSILECGVLFNTIYHKCMRLSFSIDRDNFKLEKLLDMNKKVEMNIERMRGEQDEK